jgi:hypothetical protein
LEFIFEGRSGGGGYRCFNLGEEGEGLMEKVHRLKGQPKPTCLIHKRFNRWCSQDCPFTAYCTMLVMPEFERQQAKEAKE